MNNEFKGHSLKAEKVIGQLTRSEFNGLTIWFSYAEPIGISSENYLIVNSTSYSRTTSSHVSYIKRLIVSFAEMNFEDFEERLERILNKSSNLRWNSYD